MNLILFEQHELSGNNYEITLTSKDLRSIHLKKILKADEGTILDAGIINGRQGKAIVYKISNDEYHLSFTPETEPEALYPLTLLLGLSRPPTVKKVLKEATALGIERFILCGTENGEQSYRQSSALQPDKIREVLIEGAQQACCTMLPEVSVEHSLRYAVELINTDKKRPVKIGLDNYEPEMSLTSYLNLPETIETLKRRHNKIILAVGSERGWTDGERQRLRDYGFTLLSLGTRVLRTETASIAGSAVCLSGMGLL
jgi:RsmE family RNA methyltransferase